MKMIALGYSLLFMVSLGVNAQTASEYDDLYSACLDQAGSINNGVVMECSGEVAEQAEIEMMQRYNSIYARLVADSPDDAQKLESSQNAWRVYRDTQCDLAGMYVGSPMYGFCPMQLNAARALELREFD